MQLPHHLVGPFALLTLGLLFVFDPSGPKTFNDTMLAEPPACTLRSQTLETNLFPNDSLTAAVSQPTTNTATTSTVLSSSSSASTSQSSLASTVLLEVTVIVTAELQHLAGCSATRPCSQVIVLAGQHALELSDGSLNDDCLWHSNTTTFEEGATLSVDPSAVSASLLAEGSVCLFTFDHLAGWPDLILAGSYDCLSAELNHDGQAAYIQFELSSCSSSPKYFVF